MIVRRLGECPEFVAGDHTHLRELLHPGSHVRPVGYSLAHGTTCAGRSFQTASIGFIRGVLFSRQAEVPFSISEDGLHFDRTRWTRMVSVLARHHVQSEWSIPGPKRWPS